MPITSLEQDKITNVVTTTLDQTRANFKQGAQIMDAATADASKVNKNCSSCASQIHSKTAANWVMHALYFYRMHAPSRAHSRIGPCGHRAELGLQELYLSGALRLIVPSLTNLERCLLAQLMTHRLSRYARAPETKYLLDATP